MSDILTLIGGIGLFLFGMQTMTGALRDLASHQARRILAGFTHTPASGVVTGALTTAVIQSSSATTVTTIGFVGAGLLTFPQAIGIIFGANIGTTITGWMVMFLGIKLQLGVVALPLMFAGSLLQLLTRGRARQIGTALAGFSLIFLGLDMMQAGTAAFQGQITPQSFPPDTLWGRLQMLAIGIAITVVVQSSSAGIAMTLVLLGSGTIAFPQAAAMIIGMDIGTTATGMVATLGGSRAMRRTGFAHLFYNLITGTLAYATLGMVTPVLLEMMANDAQAALVAFHTAFNLAGVVLMLPLTNPFARLIEWMVPDHGLRLGNPPDRDLLSEPGAALDSASTAARDIARVLFTGLGEALRADSHQHLLAEAYTMTNPALEELHAYLARIALPDGRDGQAARYAALLHQYDHLQRLRHRCNQSDRIVTLLETPRLARPGRAVGAALIRLSTGIEPDTARLDRLSQLVVRREARWRLNVVRVPAPKVFDQTDALRWLRRVCIHAARIEHYGAIARALPAVQPEQGT